MIMSRVGRYLDSLSAALTATPREPLHAIEQTLWETYLRDGTVIMCGNGGSAATASHFACDLAKWTICEGQRRLRALALTDNVPIMSAWSNDTSYERMFVEQLISLYRPGDCLVAISGSGNSPNVLRVTEWASAQGAPTISMTGFSGGKLATISTVGIIVPSHHMPEVEDVHSALCHALAVGLGERIQQIVAP